MVASERYNQTHNKSIKTVYGCVTTGEVWQFLRLQDNQLLIDNKRYYITDVTHASDRMRAVASQKNRKSLIHNNRCVTSVILMKLISLLPCFNPLLSRLESVQTLKQGHFK